MSATDGAGGAGKTAPGGWSTTAKVAASLAIGFHSLAVLAGVWGAPPASRFERQVAQAFAPYNELIDQGYSYRYYIDPPPTPIILATVKFQDGRPDKPVRIPDPEVRPRLLYQRQLSLANSLSEDFEDARRHGEADHSRWARAFAKHLGAVNPGATSVVLQRRFHLIPELGEIARELAERPYSRKGIDLDAERYYTAPERIGEFPCDGSSAD